MNPEVMLFTVESGARVSMELGIGVGRGYEAADHKRERRPAPSWWTRPSRRSRASPTTSRCRASARSRTTRSSWSRSGPTGSVGPDDALHPRSTFLRDHFAPLRRGAGGGRGGQVASGEATREALGKTPGGAGPARARDQRAQGRRQHLVADLVRRARPTSWTSELAKVHRRDQDGAAALGLSLGMRYRPECPRRARTRPAEASDEARQGQLQARRSPRKLRCSATPSPLFRHERITDDRGQGQGGTRRRRAHDHLGQARELHAPSPG